MDFFSAEEFCNGKGGTLVEIENIVKNTFIQAFLYGLTFPSSPFTYWIGATDIDEVISNVFTE